MSDFVDWDDSDVDLAELLGEWTDYDAEVSSESWSDENVDKSEIVTKRRKLQEDATKTTYKCPCCERAYKSVSGFRGHMLNKHQKTDVKAYSHKLTGDTATIDRSATVDRPATSSRTSKSAQSTKIKTVAEEKFSSFLHQGVQKVRENEHHNSKFSKSGPIIIAICRNVEKSGEVLSDLKDVLKKPFLEILSVYGENMSFERDQEMMWTKFHSMRTDLELCTTLQSLVSKVSNESTIYIQGFIQGLLSDLLQVIMSQFTINIEDEVHNVEFTDEDNSVLFYVSGFLIKALMKKAAKKNDKLMSNILEGFCAKSSETSPSFLQKFKKWTEKVSRGGLKICGDNFFFTVRKMESICREKVNIKNLTAISTLKTVLIEEILEDVTIQYYFDKLVQTA